MVAVRDVEPGQTLVSRPVEDEAIADFLTTTLAPAALLIDGEAGIGKSTLWGTGVALAMRHGVLVLAARPAQAEARMSFAGLADLLDQVADTVLPALASPQRAVLEVALLRRRPTGSAPHEREIGAAVLAALRHLAGAASVLVAIDDLQWLDQASAEVLAFALRRLRGESIRILLTVRTGEFPGQATDGPSEAARTVLDALGPLTGSTLRLGAWADRDLARVVRVRIGELPSAAAEAGLLAVSSGNPYWALELGQAIVAGDGPPDELTVPASLSALLARRLAGHESTTRAALLVVAALARPTWGATCRALAMNVADPDAAIDAAVAAHLITETAGRLRPAHPLLGSAALLALTPGQRHRLHRDLAVVTADPEQRARHLALATDGEPDAEIAHALDAGSRSARSRGAIHPAAELAELAIRLTPTDERDELGAATSGSG